MSPNADELVRQALALPEDARAELASLLIESLDEGLELDEDYEREIARRIEASDRGEVERIPWDEARRRMFGADDAPSP